MGIDRFHAHSVCLTTSFAPLTLTSPHHLSDIPSIPLGPETPMHMAQPLQHPLQLALPAAASTPGTPCVLCLCTIYLLLPSGPLSSFEKKFRCHLLLEPSTTSPERVGQPLCPWLSLPISPMLLTAWFGNSLSATDSSLPWLPERLCHIVFVLSCLFPSPSAELIHNRL